MHSRSVPSLAGQTPSSANRSIRLRLHRLRVPVHRTRPMTPFWPMVPDASPRLAPPLIRSVRILYPREIGLDQVNKRDRRSNMCFCVATTNISNEICAAALASGTSTAPPSAASAASSAASVAALQPRLRHHPLHHLNSLYNLRS
jgi:hypothetical protein